MKQKAKKFGLTLAALILAVLFVGTAALAPCLVGADDGEGGQVIQDSSGIRIERSGGGEPVAPPLGSPGGGGILFEQPPYDPWDQGWASDKNVVGGVLCIEDFWGLTGNICDIHWWGVSLGYPSLYDCDPTGMEFEIIFYQDSGGAPGAPVATFSNIIPTVTYLYTSGNSVYRFDVADLGTRVGLTKGWVSIQSTSSPNGCSLWWLNSPTGNNNLIQSGTSYSDNLAFALTEIPPPPNVKYLHCTDGLFNLTDPIGTQWHELWPIFCREYHLSSWEDNGDGILSYCDRIDMYEKPDGAVKWYHVEEVTITLFVTFSGQIEWLEEVPEPMYIEYEGGYNLTILKNPLFTQWHEIYPVFCREYELVNMQDSGDPRGELSFCDDIVLQNKCTGEETVWHVEEVAVDIIVTPEPPPVGGEAYPVSKASVLAPWITMGVVVVGGISWHVLSRRRAQS